MNFPVFAHPADQLDLPQEVVFSAGEVLDCRHGLGRMQPWEAALPSAPASWSVPWIA